MKEKIIIGLIIFSMIFILGGIYIITTIERGTKTLNDLIILHQVEILREHLLIQVQRVQTDLYLKNTKFARDTNTVTRDVRGMQKISDRCLGCHHDSEDVMDSLTNLRDHIEAYKNALSRVFTLKAVTSRPGTEENKAFLIGENLVSRVSNMIVFTSERLEKKTKSTLKEITHAKIALFLFVVTGPLLSIGLAFIFIRAFTKPVNKLLDATRRLNSGDLDYRIEGLKDEFGEVAKSFNEMAGSLKEQMIRMQQTEQLKVCGELTAGLAHEIKNPLAGIKLSMEVLSEDSSISEEDRTILLRVADEIRRIELLLKNLLNFARPSAPQLMLTNINKILHTTIDFSQRHPAFLSGSSQLIDIRKHFDDRLPETMADPMQLQQIFLNLFLNAADAMPEGGTLEAKTFYDAPSNCIKIEISDTGRGINRDMMDEIFKPFFTTKAKGTGLGLAITKQLIMLHGGTIDVLDRPAGGSVFRLVFAVRQTEEAGTI